MKRGHPHQEPRKQPASPHAASCPAASAIWRSRPRNGSKRQKNGNVHRYVYYRCTKKSAVRCSQPYIREENLAADLSALLSQYAMPPVIAQYYEQRMKEDELEAGKYRLQMRSNPCGGKVKDIDRQLERLTDVYIAQDIERETYLERRRALMSEKKTIEEQIARLGRDVCAWLEPMREWVKDASLLAKRQPMTT